ncbi:hypothetical protein RB195_007148 [Necator americanus]|uniref:Uncharacterized protein n=1 Tax=Necator americanus TaxID=51031 RepID=A0ABR1BW05_NECAM
MDFEGAWQALFQLTAQQYELLSEASTSIRIISNVLLTLTERGSKQSTIAGKKSPFEQLSSFFFHHYHINGYMTIV